MIFPPALLHTLQTARHIAVLTGAGTSAESGIPTFREAQTGLWARYDPEELATPQAFRQNPRLVWEWYAWRRELVSQAKPNSGHYALAEMEQQVRQFTLITQNVDGLHQRAGSQNVIELHGNIGRTKCFACGKIMTEWAEVDDPPPHCPSCNGRLRPDVVWFGENLPVSVLNMAIQAAQACDVLLVVGTSAVVQPAASIPLEAIQRRIPTVEINPQPTPLTPHITYVLSGPSGVVLPALLQDVWMKGERRGAKGER